MTQAAVFTIHVPGGPLHLYMASGGTPGDEEGGVSSLSDAAGWLESRFTMGSYACAWIACVFDNGVAVLDEQWPDGPAGRNANFHYTVTGNETLASIRVEVRRLDTNGAVLFTGPVKEGIKWEKEWAQEQAIAAAPPPRVRTRA